MLGGLTLGGLTLAACGDPLVASDYAGVPLLSFEGQVRFIQDEPAGSDLRLSLFWAPDGNIHADPAALIEDDAVSVGVSFPSTFAVSVFRPPARSWWVAGEAYAAASILVYEDRDRSGHFNEPDVLRGGSLDRAVIYLGEATSAAQSPTGRAHAAGMYLVATPLSCGLEFVGGTEDCGVVLGSACSVDADCGTGVCQHDSAFEAFPGGYCILPESAACDPADSVLIGDDDGANYYKACGGDAECRVAEGYECFLNACLPAVPVSLDFYPGFQPNALCLEDG